MRTLKTKIEKAIFEKPSAPLLDENHQLVANKQE